MLVRTVVCLSFILALLANSPAHASPIPGSVMWFDASDVDGDGNSGNNPLSGSALGTWVDKAAAQGTQNLVQATGTRQPTYLTNFQNAQAAVQFDGVNDILAASGLSLGAYTVLMQFNSNNGATTMIMEQSTDLNASGNGFYWVNTSGHTIQARRASTTSGKNVTAPTPPAWAFQPNLLTATQAYNGTHASHLMYIDGVVANLATADGGNPGTATVTDTLHLGDRFGTGSPVAPFNGQFAEIVIYNSNLITAQRLIVENYLSAKYDSTMAGNDFYDGDTFGNGDYDFDVFGIGSEADGTVSSGSYGSGLSLAEDGASLSPGEYVLAGRDNSNPSNIVMTDLAGSGASERLERIWYLEKTGLVDATITFNLDDLGLAVVPGSTYDLLYRTGTSGNFSNLGLLASVSGDDVSFLVLDGDLNNGFYTLGITAPVPEPSTLALLGLGAIGLAIKIRRRRTTD